MLVRYSLFYLSPPELSDQHWPARLVACHLSPVARRLSHDNLAQLPACTYLHLTGPPKTAEEHRRKGSLGHGPGHTKQGENSNNNYHIDVHAYLHDQCNGGHSLPIVVLPLPQQPAASSQQHNPPPPPQYTSTEPLHTHDARTDTVRCSSVGGNRRRITSLAVPCFDAAAHPALRNPHVHSPISCCLFLLFAQRQRGNTIPARPWSKPDSPSPCPVQCPGAQRPMFTAQPLPLAVGTRVYPTDGLPPPTQHPAPSKQQAAGSGLSSAAGVLGCSASVTCMARRHVPSRPRSDSLPAFGSRPKDDTLGNSKAAFGSKAAPPPSQGECARLNLKWRSPHTHNPSIHASIPPSDRFLPPPPSPSECVWRCCIHIHTHMHIRKRILT